MEQVTYLILPGYQNSLEGHWQTRWERCLPNCQRVMQGDWDSPDCDAWVTELERAVAASGENTVFVAHSMGCLLTAHWAARTCLTIKGALLVAVPDPNGAEFPPTASGFTETPLNALPFKSIVVVSTNDPYGSIDFAAHCAQAWGSQMVTIGERGHINGDSGLGDWPDGLSWLKSLGSKKNPQF